MRKTLLLLVIISFCTFLSAQELDNAAALKLVNNNAAEIGLSSKDLQNIIVSNAYTSKSSGIQMVYLQQSYKGLPVYNQLQVLAFRDGKLISKTGGRIKGIEQKTAMTGSIPGITAEKAVIKAAHGKKLLPKNFIGSINGKKIDFGKLGIAQENVTAELMWAPIKNGEEVRLAWQVTLVPNTTPDYFLIRVDAFKNEIIDETNLTVYCKWHNVKDNISKDPIHVLPGCTGYETIPASSDITSTVNLQEKLLDPDIINGATYRVIPFPAESPRHPGGAPALRTNPWSAAPGNATTLKWHSDGTTDFNITRGNNVWAQEDLNANNGTGFSPVSTTGPDPLSFNFTPDFSITPTQTTPIQNHHFNITNLFYWNNIIHDIFYQYGFDETSGNFQANNLGRGGIGNDFVMADAQDGNFIPPNQNNANFSSPPDGSSPRMQMYLFDSVGFFVNSPAVIAGPYPYTQSNFSLNNKLIITGPVTGQVVYYNDNPAGTTHEACGPPDNNITGKIALIDRGTCNFVIKVKNAQDAGAIAVIVANNIPGPLSIMSGSDNSIRIPAIFISDVDGALIAAQLANNVNVTMSAGVSADGDVDNGIIVHEYGHGITNRLTGGPAQSGCVSNGEHMSEGWSDYYFLMLTQNWSVSNVNTGFNTSRSVGTYASGQGTNGPGFRTKKYSTNFAVNNLVYQAALPGMGLQHDRGEIWCATLWDMTWNIIQQVNNINPDIYNIAGGGGNTIALRLVVEGLKLQPCGPGFLDARDAILQADKILYGGTYSCAIKEAFRRRGMGPLASQGSADNASDQVPDYSAPVTISLTQNVTQVTEGQNIVYTNTLSACSAVSNYLLTDTLPSNVTYVSGGTYNSGNRVISFPVNLSAGQTQAYTFTVMVNAGTFYPTVTLLNEPFATATMPATLIQTSTTATIWNVTNTQSKSAPYSVFSPNAPTPSEQILTTSSGLALGANPSQLTFWHQYNTEQGYDGGVVEISTNGGANWVDLGNKMNLNGYNGTIDLTSGNTLAGRAAYTGLSNSFIKTSVNLSAYVNQTALFRWRFGSDAAEAAVGWYVDDILVKREPLVHMRSSVFNNTAQRIAYSDTITLITELFVCTNVSISTQPANLNVCSGNNATFTIVAEGTSPTYQWQVSTNGGTIWTNINTATTASLLVPSVTSAMNNYRYRAIVNNTCPSTITSNGAILTVSDPAGITTQPANVIVCAGENASFTITTSGTNITYQWQVSNDGGTTFTNIAGATTATLSLTGVTTGMNANQYHVILISCNPANLTSANVTLTVNSPVTITTQPVNTNACTGGSATFTVIANGTLPGFQWQVSTNGGTTWTNIAGAGSPSYTLTGITSGMNNYRYRVLVSNACPSGVISNPVTLLVSDPATITTQPADESICVGDDALFNVIAAGNNISYQWQVSTDGGVIFTDITGATSTTLSLQGVTPSQHGNLYRVVIFSCSPGGVNSNSASLTVTSATTITIHPSNVSACTGTSASFSVSANGNNLAYQWQVSTDDGVNYININGQTTTSLILSNVTLAMNDNRYRVIINGSCSGPVISNGAILNVSSTAIITTQPASITTCSGNSATFTSTASGPAFQWQISTNGGTNWTDINGENSASLTLLSVNASMNNNQYRLVVSSCSSGELNSNPATLTVNNTAVINSQPSNETVCTGDNASFTITASGTDLNYQWQLSTDGGITYNDIGGSTSATLLLTGVGSAMNNNRYRAIVSNACTSNDTSGNALLIVNNSSVINTQPADISVCAGGNASFSIAASGTSNTYQWQISTNGGTGFTNIAGETGETISITNVTAGMNDNRYRVIINGCSQVTSLMAVLTIHATPIVVINASPFTSLLPDQTTLLTAISTPPAFNFTWFKDGVLIPGVTNNSLSVSYSGLGNYAVSVTDVNDCSGISESLRIGDSTINTVFIYPNPNRGIFYVRYNVGEPVSQSRFITIYDAKGGRVYNKINILSSPREKIEVDISHLTPGVYMLKLSDASGKQLAKGRVIILK